VEEREWERKKKGEEKRKGRDSDPDQLCPYL